MIPPALFNSEEQLFQDMSSAGEDEDWTSIEHYNRKKSASKRNHEASSGDAEIGQLGSRSLNAPGSEGSTKKKLKFNGELVVEEPLKILPRTIVGTPTVGRAGHSNSPRPVSDTSTALHTAGSAEFSVSDPRPLRVLSPEHIPKATRQQGSSLVLPVKELATSASGPVPGEKLSHLTDLKPPAKRSSSGGPVRFITKEALLRQNKASSSKTLAGKKRKGGVTADLAKTAKQLTYFEYAVKIMNRLHPVILESKILSDLVLFMVTSEPARNPVTTKTQLRLDYVIKHGGKVQPQFDPATATHIICDLPSRQTSTKNTIKQCLDGTIVDEVPWRIRIVPWTWVCNSVTDRKLADQLKAELDFDETPGRPIRDTPELTSPTIDRQESCEKTLDTNVNTAADPLARFYAHAIYGDDDIDVDIKNHDNDKHTRSGEIPRLASATSSETPRGKTYKGYACKNAEHSKGTGLNDDIIAKIAEILATGGLERIQFEQTEEHTVCKALCGIYGVGATTAYQWYQNGIRSLDDVRWGKGGLILSETQKIGLEHYDDLQDRMPRGEAAAIFEKIKLIALKLDPNLLIEITGSYRRGSANCGDIDILITRCTNDGRTHRGILPRLMRALQEGKLLTHTLATPADYEAPEAKCMGLCRLNDGSKIRRLDILTIPYEQWGASLLYFTGDDIFNRSMRLLARHKNMSLNQRGLFKGVIRDPKTGVKQYAGTLVASRTEEEIFEILGVPWQLPHERVRSR
ncbi:hypothetical protein FRB96_001995 [Tulasnella sp. 330]|nr:hypothetical protein FRB96_001995 [Tulasnella sp. 330]KAG8885066.1 hypothetical protein FRB98_002025 [Tulasnella sp. 332]